MVKDFYYKDLIDYSVNFCNAIKTVDLSLIDKLENEILKRLDGVGEIFLVGNGGSSANAHHIAGDYMKTFSLIGKSLKISSLTDNACFLTAASNDIDFTEIYETLVGTRISKDDLIIFLSGSGNSMNLIKAARKAKRLGIKTVGLIGYTGGSLKNIVDIPIHFHIDDMEISEDCQMSVFHFIKQKIINTNSFLDTNSSSKYEKRTQEDLIA